MNADKLEDVNKKQIMLRLMVSRLHFSKSFCSSQGNVYLRQTKAQTLKCNCSVVLRLSQTFG